VSLPPELQQACATMIQQLMSEQLVHIQQMMQQTLNGAVKYGTQATSAAVAAPAPASAVGASATDRAKGSVAMLPTHRLATIDRSESISDPPCAKVF
jgi:hypothetical protein